MATKKEETVSMVDTFREFKETKNIDRTTLVSVLEESFRNVLAKIFGSDENFDVIVNPDKGDFEIYRNRMVVADGEVEDENKEMEAELKLVDTEEYIVSSAVTQYAFMNRNDLRFRITNPEALYAYTENELKILMDELAD
jgi:N utilization substance protein A